MVKKICLQCRRPQFDSWVRKIPWRRGRHPFQYSWAFLVAQLVKNPPAMQETWVWSQGWEETLEKGMATHSSILAWVRKSWTPYTGSQRVGHDWATFTFTLVEFNELAWVLIGSHRTGINPQICLTPQLVLRDQASSLAPDWIPLLQRPRIPASFMAQQQPFNTFHQEHKKWLYTWTSPKGQYQNQIDYLLCSWR